jgi:predicted transposase/invertase (TIGR01784 family)
VFGEGPDEKKSIFDLYCVTQDADHVIIEMQRARQSFFLKHLPEMLPDEEGFTKGIFKSLMETCRMEKLSDMEKKDYEKSVLEYEDVQDAIAFARETALEEGLARGKTEGIAEGKAEGEANAIRMIAAKMLDNEMDLPTIASLTGLTEKEILAING